MSKQPRISDAEWIVMEALWADAPLTAEQVVKSIVSKADWKEPTIKTMLNRLVKKGALKFETQGKRYLYRPAVSRETCVRGESRSFAKRVFGGEMGAMIAHFVERANLTPEELAQLRRLIDKRGR
jgi:BlaI family penicillinase repressor